MPYNKKTKMLMKLAALKGRRDSLDQEIDDLICYLRSPLLTGGWTASLTEIAAIMDVSRQAIWARTSQIR